MYDGVCVWVLVYMCAFVCLCACVRVRVRVSVFVLKAINDFNSLKDF